MGLEARKHAPQESGLKEILGFEPAPLKGGSEQIHSPKVEAKIKMPEMSNVESVETLSDDAIEELTDEEADRILEEADTVKDAEASAKLAKARAEATTLAVGLASGGSYTAEKTGEIRQEASGQEVTSLGETEESERSINLARQKFAKKLETSPKENVLMEIEMELEMELENKGYALEDAQEDNQESVARGLQMEIDALNSVQDWISKDEYKNAA